MKLETLIKQTVMRLLPAKWWVKIDYRFHMGRKCNLKNPRTFNEKLCWLKVYHKDNERTKLVDKYAVRQYIADKLGQAYVVPLLGVWKRFDEIDFNTLPENLC
ncbi:MAG TPA: ATP-grasp fold amidoligase family protein [Oscillospiraceae bacterium]|nr:ATP-grasp fold amidoligase family protein [Oscillospiraceae bacterium]